MLEKLKERLSQMNSSLESTKKSFDLKMSSKNELEQELELIKNQFANISGAQAELKYLIDHFSDLNEEGLEDKNDYNENETTTS